MMSGIANWIVGKVKWLLVVLAIGGPFFAYIGWSDAERTARIASQGVEADAAITGATRKKRRRSGTSYALNIAWKDSKGELRKADDILISHRLAERVIRDDRIVMETTRVKYLPDEPEKSGVILVEDADEQASLDSGMTYAGLGAGAIGIVGSGLFFGLGRRRSRRADTADGSQPSPSA